MMQKRRFSNLFWLITIYLFAILPLLIGCSSEAVGTTPRATVPANNPISAGSPKGPGAPSLTATAVSTTPVSNGCPTIKVTPASPDGWKIYKDAHYPFQFSFPPDWRAGSFTEENGSDYITQVFPPGSTTPFGTATKDPEHVQIAVLLAGTPSDPASDPNWQPEAGTITISGTKTVIYDRTSPSCEEVDRMAVADFGHHHFTFFMTTMPGKAKNDIALFLGMLQSFMYLR